MKDRFNEQLAARASSAGIDISPAARTQLDAYVRLLTHWNEKINLTALPLVPLTDRAIDRLLIEPIAAARFVLEAPQAWFDLGSGGGSPAIPFKIVQPSAKLIMVEATAKKAAFLREAIRVLNLSDTIVMNDRFEAIPDVWKNRSDLVTVRAVKGDAALYDALHRLLAPEGRALLFHAVESQPQVPSGMFTTVELVRLPTGDDARLLILKPVFHVEH